MAEQLIYTAEKSLKDAPSTLPEDIRKGVMEKVEALKKDKDGDNMETTKSSTEALSTELQKIGQYMNSAEAKKEASKESEPQADAGVAGQTGETTAPGPEENIRDAEVK